jgi:hypothetical protein
MRLAQWYGDVGGPILDSHRKQQTPNATRIAGQTTAQLGVIAQNHPLLQAPLNGTALVILQVALPTSPL